MAVTLVEWTGECLTNPKGHLLPGLGSGTCTLHVHRYWFWCTCTCPCTCISWTGTTLSWFPQTLKSAWIWMLSWKVLDFSICLENCQFSLKSAWNLLFHIFMGLKNKGSRNLICLCIFFMHFERLMRKKWEDSVILSSNLCHYWSGDPCFHGAIRIIYTSSDGYIEI